MKKLFLDNNQLISITSEVSDLVRLKELKLYNKSMK